MEMTEAIAKKVLETVDKGLSSGLGEPVPGQMCVEAAVCYAMGMPHGDNPACVGAEVRDYKIRLNDADWSSSAARAKGMRRVAVAQLGSDMIDQVAFSKEVVLQVTKQLLPLALRAVGLLIADHNDALEAAAVGCENITDYSQANAAANAAAKAAANAYAAAAAAKAAYANAYANAYSAATAAKAAAKAAANAYANANAKAKAYANAKAAAAAAKAAAYANAKAYAYANAKAAAAAAAAAKAAANAYANANANAYANANAKAAAAAAKAAANAYAAANANANANARNKILTMAAEIGVQALIKLGSKGCEWLFLTEQS